MWPWILKVTGHGKNPVYKGFGYGPFGCSVSGMRVWILSMSAISHVHHHHAHKHWDFLFGNRFQIITLGFPSAILASVGNHPVFSPVHTIFTLAQIYSADIFWFVYRLDDCTDQQFRFPVFAQTESIRSSKDCGWRTSALGITRCTMISRETNLWRCFRGSCCS